MLQLARPADRDAVNRLNQQVHRLHVAWRPDIFRPETDLLPEDLFLELIQHRELYVAKLETQIVGYVVLRQVNQGGPGTVSHRAMLLDHICVDEHCRRQGIGTQILEDVRALARAFGCDMLRLSVYPENEEAVAFYQKCGFTIRNITMHAYL